MFNLIKFFSRGVRGFSPTSNYSLKPVSIGRMKPEQTLEDIIVELEKEVQHCGIESLKEKIQVEQKYLPLLEKQLDECRKKICNITHQVRERARQGYNIHGLYWQKTQQDLQQHNAVETLQQIQEKMDWVRARQRAFAELKPVLINAGEPNEIRMLNN